MKYKALPQEFFSAHPFKIYFLESGSITLAENHTHKGTTSLKDEVGSYFVQVALLGTGFLG